MKKDKLLNASKKIQTWIHAHPRKATIVWDVIHEFDDAIARLESEPEPEEKHETCNGCQMFAECGCMLDDSCPECVDHHLWTPKEPEPQMTAEEILKDNLSDYFWDMIALPGIEGDKPFKNMVIEAMQAYAEQ
jgi:hypothetical protein